MTRPVITGPRVEEVRDFPSEGWGDGGVKRWKANVLFGNVDKKG